MIPGWILEPAGESRIYLVGVDGQRPSELEDSDTDHDERDSSRHSLELGLPHGLVGPAASVCWRAIDLWSSKGSPNEAVANGAVSAGPSTALDCDRSDGAATGTEGTVQIVWCRGIGTGDAN